MTENEVAKEIVDVAFKIHSAYGPGLLESVYEASMAHELGKRGLTVPRQQPIPLVHENIRMGVGFRADLIVQGKVVVEIKSIEMIGAGPQEATANVSPVNRQASRPPDQLQCRVN